MARSSCKAIISDVIGLINIARSHDIDGSILRDTRPVTMIAVYKPKYDSHAPDHHIKVYTTKGVAGCHYLSTFLNMMRILYIFQNGAFAEPPEYRELLRLPAAEADSIHLVAKEGAMIALTENYAVAMFLDKDLCTPKTMQKKTDIIYIPEKHGEGHWVEKLEVLKGT